MTITLTQPEIQEAIAQSLGSTYDVQSMRIIVGRGKSSTKIEVEVNKVQDTVNNCVEEPKDIGEEPVEKSAIVPSKPIFETVHGD
jgi:hypothetical protein